VIDMEFKIGKRKIGEKNPVFVVAELSANHNQEFEVAARSIEAAKDAGADAVKVQTFTPETITLDCQNEYFQINNGTLWDGKTLFELYKETYMPWEWQPKLKEIAEDLDMVFFSTPFDRSAVDFLEEMDIPAYKVASLEITDIPLIEHISSKGKPIIISTGIATLSDIEDAVDACERMGNDQIALMKCTSSYPAPLDEINLRSIPELAETFNTPVGISDHTLGITVPIAAVALEAKIIEKHFILDSNLGGPDATFSLEPEEFRSMVESVREVEEALGKANYERTGEMEKSREFSRSLFVVKNIREGDLLTEDNIRSIRPGYGIHPKYFKEILGKRVKSDIKRGTPLRWEIIA
jgi:pseudaminic acid synthase